MPIMMCDGELWRRMRWAQEALEDVAAELAALIEPPIEDVTIEPHGEPEFRVVMVRLGADQLEYVDGVCEKTGLNRSEVVGMLVAYASQELDICAVEREECSGSND